MGKKMKKAMRVIAFEQERAIKMQMAEDQRQA